MTDLNIQKVYNYPKSLSNCYNCNAKDHLVRKGTLSNMSVDDCDYSDYFECYDNLKLNTSRDIQPTLQKGSIVYNPQAIIDKLAPDFQGIETSECSLGGGCNTTQYWSNDPRLRSTAHNGQMLTLDRPPIDSTIPLDSINIDPILDGYGQNYKSYDDINAGQITYYQDLSVEAPFFEPNFVTSASVDSVLYKDPMGAMKTQYYRTPLIDDNPIGSKRNNYEGGLSWIQDSLSHRQNLMASQMLKINQQRWGPRERAN